ncbi:hypothetical protein KUV44_10135 [Marinobacter daepoensis]|uniref:DUF2059 domain-containing protein n=1 Tax=Marinobacter daepoensis TaxID=262077 RepID=A0ABS3BDH5_9GAMM|nr:hypothetical protein [Marinobacter daepoensis]MBN7768762.1 hypothetical protein [Marinobacter daepoensis]MBY6032779.1 hypothetical protein [Marinobacter daepoensis]MBY6079499.1 hypothetical protein [Marinobacter daepoensis]
MTHLFSHLQRRLVTATLCLLCLALAPGAYSQDLTEKDVTSFIASMKAVQPLGDKHQAFIDSLEESEDDDHQVNNRIMASMVEMVKGHEMYDDLDDLVEDFGFSTPEAWARTGDQILNTWMALEMEGQEDMTPDRAEMERAFAEMENDPNLPESVKSQMREAAEQSAAMFENAQSIRRNASEHDKQVVRPYLEQLRETMDQGSENEEDEY